MEAKLADFVLLDADSLADITHLRRIYRVVKGGLIFDPQDLVGPKYRAGFWRIGKLAGRQ